MYKFLLLIALVVAIVCIAKGVAKQYTDKLRFFQNLKSFFDIYGLNLGFKKDKIRDIVKNFQTDGEASEFFLSYLNFLEKGGDIEFNSKIISDEDKKIIKDIFKSLGQGDYVTEKEQLKITMSYLNGQIETSKSESDKFCPLILKLSFLFALLVAILFI